MKDEHKERYAQLPPMKPQFQLPEPKEMVKRMQWWLRFYLGYVDLSDPKQRSTMDFYRVLILSRLLIYGRVDVVILIHEIQECHPNIFSPLDFDAACRIVYDWCTTGGENVAKIGEGLY